MREQIGTFDRLVDRLLTLRRAPEDWGAQQAAWASLQAQMDRSSSQVQSAQVRRVESGRRPMRREVFSRQPLRHNLAVIGGVLMGVLGAIIVGTSGPSPSSTPSTRTYTTIAGQQSTITLADGSRARLGPATTLTFTSSAAHVDVHVNGQALFTVMHYRAHPFRVHSGSAIAQVLGTTFLVRRYATDRVARVVVMDGRVSLAGVSGDAIVGTRQVLTTNMMGVVDDSGHVQTTTHMAVEDYTGWASGKLVLHNTPARDAVTELGRAYDVEIRIPDSTRAAQPVTWTVPVTQQSLADVLEVLAEVLDIHAVRAGRIITLIPGRSGHPRPAGQFPLSPQERQYGR